MKESDKVYDEYKEKYMTGNTRLETYHAYRIGSLINSLKKAIH